MRSHGIRVEFHTDYIEGHYHARQVNLEHGLLSIRDDHLKLLSQMDIKDIRLLKMEACYGE